MSLERFKTAQASRSTGYDVAREELTTGRKCSHWIWYIFPQLGGLGGSAMSANYAIRDLAEAVEFLSDPLLGARLAQLTAIVTDHLARRVPLAELMGSEIDALKLVSSLTLFEAAANALSTPQMTPERKVFLANCRTALEYTAKQGYPRCRFTLERVSGQHGN